MDKRTATEKRTERMIGWYREGSTLEYIGELEGLTRERVRQILSAQGITAQDGGYAVSVRREREAKKAAREAEILPCGFTRAEREALRDFGKELMGRGVSWGRTPIGAFTNQKKNAHERGVAWGLTLKEWWGIWQDSGKWDARGRGDGKYVMSRYGDRGGYEAGNVFIQSAILNNSNRPQKTKTTPIGVQPTVSGRFVAQRMVEGVLRYLGTHDTVEEAQKAYDTGSYVRERGPRLKTRKKVA